MPWQERWELRTGMFGCNCSTTTFLAALITCLSTIASLLILWLLWALMRAIWLSVRAPRGGWRIDVVHEIDGSHWREGIWVRKRPGIFARMRQRVTASKNDKKGSDPDLLVVDEQRPLLE